MLAFNIKMGLIAADAAEYFKLRFWLNSIVIYFYCYRNSFFINHSILQAYSIEI